MLPDTVVGTTCEGDPATWADLDRAAQDVREWLRLKTTTGACSASFIYQLAWHLCRIPQSFGRRPLLVHVHAVFDEIGALERAPMARGTSTGKVEPLSGPLEGLFHKHWFQAAFIAKNLLEETNQHGDAIFWKFLKSKFGDNGWVGQPFTEQLAGELTHQMVRGALSHRSGTDAGKKSRLTGEWIVFAKTRGRNVYLTLGGHDEPNEAILSRCSLALGEFPELAALPAFRSS